MIKVPMEKQLRSIKRLQDFPIAQVVWKDSTSNGGWGSLKTFLGYKCFEIVSIGYLIQNNNKNVKLLQSISEGSNVNDSINIPKPWVGSITIIKGAKLKLVNPDSWKT